MYHPKLQIGNIMNIFQVLSFGQRVIVYSEEGDGIIITWNYSNTFSLFSVNGSEFSEIDVCTYGGDKNLSFEDAKEFALNWTCQMQGDIIYSYL